MTAIGTLMCDLAQSLQDGGVILRMPIRDINIDTSYIEIEVIFNKEYTKLKPFAVLRAVISVFYAI